MSLHVTDIIRIAKQVMPVANLNVWERSYSVPSLDWVTGDFAKWHFDHRTPYSLNRFDCNNLAIEAAIMARQMHARTSKELSGLAFGWLLYTPEHTETGVQYDPVGHCISWFISGKPGEERVWYFEPQRSYTVQLTPNEIDSISDLYM